MDSNVEIRVFRDDDELNRAAAERLLEVARQSVAARKLFAAAFSGGSTPRPFFRLLAQEEFSWCIPWESTHLFQVDERNVPPDDPQSNYRLIREALLEYAPLPAGHFHRMEAENPDLASAARSYSTELQKTIPSAPPVLPRFDFVQLGLGTNGHTASLFPGTEALSERELWVVANQVPELNAWRLTLTYPVINAAREALFLVAGEEKAEVVRRVLYPAGPADSFPAQGVKLENGRVRWYLDEAAARLLPQASR